jgi:hypothetical protein
MANQTVAKFNVALKDLVRFSELDQGQFTKQDLVKAVDVVKELLVVAEAGL